MGLASIGCFLLAIVRILIEIITTDLAFDYGWAFSAFMIFCQGLRTIRILDFFI